jgi:hypothetical protein
MFFVLPFFVTSLFFLFSGEHAANGGGAHQVSGILLAVDDLRNYSELNTPFWIRDIMARIRIHGSVLLTYGSGSCFFRQWLTKSQQKISFISKCFAFTL